MGVYGKVSPVLGTGILDKVARHPVVLAGAGNVFDNLSPVTAMQLGPALARRTDIADSEALIVSHCHNGRLAVARVAGDAHLFCIDSLVGLEVIESAAGAPCPCAQSAPVIGLAVLSFVGETNDA